MSVVTLSNITHMQHNYYCSYCKTSDDIIIDTTFGDAICRGCGLVVCERMPSLEAEWRNYDGDGEDTSHRARAGKINDFDDGNIFFAGGFGTQAERDLLSKVQSRCSSYSGAATERMNDIGEITYQLGLSGHIKVSMC